MIELERLVRPKRGTGRLKTALVREPIGAALVREPRHTAQSYGTGLIPPLSEDIAAREYHPVQTLVSNDGLFTLFYQPAAALVFADAAETEFRFELGLPE